MAFKKNFKPRGSSSIVSTTSLGVVIDENNSRSIQELPDSKNYKPLPAPETFSLEKKIKAGIPLTPVNSKIVTTEPSESVLERANDFIDKELSNLIDEE